MLVSETEFFRPEAGTTLAGGVSHQTIDRANFKAGGRHISRWAQTLCRPPAFRFCLYGAPWLTPRARVVSASGLFRARNNLASFYSHFNSVRQTTPSPSPQTSLRERGARMRRCCILYRDPSPNHSLKQVMGNLLHAFIRSLLSDAMTNWIDMTRRTG